MSSSLTIICYSVMCCYHDKIGQLGKTVKKVTTSFCIVISLHDSNFYTFLVDGQWGPFGNWSTCSQTCGGGTRIRERKCNDPPPSNGGLYCVGSAIQQHSCNTDACLPSKKMFI